MYNLSKHCMVTDTDKDLGLVKCHMFQAGEHKRTNGQTNIQMLPNVLFPCYAVDNYCSMLQSDLATYPDLRLSKF